MHTNHQTDHKTRANAIRALTMDAVQKANSGHPGAPMGMADIAEVLWLQFLKHNPANPSFSNRDRFVLSNGHGSMLLYSLLHLTGYELSIEDLKSFRQLHSKTPGHPELGYTAGVETTTGPLGAGIANAVGMAIAEKTLAAQFNRPDYPVVDHFTYCFLGDGCLMEGLSHEACSLAGTLGLGKLIAFWDDNGISIDGHNPDQIADAITQAQAETARPTLICCKTIIGFGSPNKSGSHDCHGSPLGDSEIAKAREFLQWPYAPFEIPVEIYAGWDSKTKGAALEQHWTELFAAYTAEYPELAAEYQRRAIERVLPANFEAATQSFIDHCQNQQQDIASRKASQLCIDHFAALLPEVLGGSADLAGSNLTLWSGSKGLTKDDSSGNYIYYGVREFGMTAIMNGITAHGGFRCYGATFLMFMEYARNAVRMSALMKLPNIYVFTHDSIGQGEDGPTHQPIEQLTNLRTTPNLVTWRPADLTETAVAWKTALTTTTSPSALVFSRQNLRQYQRSAEQISLISKGGYILKDCGNTPDIVLIATGSELQLACDTAEKLSAAGKKVNVVSMPSTSLFDQQSTSYQDAVLPAQAQIVAIEAAHPDFWHKYVGRKGLIIGISSFGESAPGPALLNYFGFNAEVIAQKILAS
jgi:transketolase